MVALFWDVQRILFIEFVLKGEMITARCYIETLDQLKEKFVKEERIIMLRNCKIVA